MTNLVVDIPTHNIHTVALDPYHEIHVLYKLMMEMLVMAEMQKVYEEQTGCVISDRCNILLTKKNLEQFSQGVYEQFLSYPDTQFPVKSVQNWLIQSFRDLNDARKTIARLSCKVVEPVITSADQLETFLAQQFAGLVSEDVKIGLPDESINYQGDYDRMKLALDQTYDALPILVVMEKFSSAEFPTIDQIVLYFGAHHLVSLNQARFWDQFGLVESLQEYISESPEPLVESRDHVISSSDVYDGLYAILLKCLSPLFKDKYGLEKRDISVFNLVTVLRGLRSHPESHVTSSRKLFSESHCFSPGSDNRLFFKWAQEVGLYQQDFASTQQEKFSICKRRRDPEEEEVVEGKRPSLDVCDEDLFEGKRLSVQTQMDEDLFGEDLFANKNLSPVDDLFADKRKSPVDDLFADKNLSPDTDLFADKFLNNDLFSNKSQSPGPESSPPWTLVESRRPNHPIDQLVAAKRSIANLIASNPEWCPLCTSLGHSSYCMDDFSHPFDSCPLNHMLEIRDCDSMTAGGHLTNHLLYKLRALEQNSYLPVYTDGSQTIKGNGLNQDSGVGVWFGDHDQDNEALPCHAKTPLETELMAIILALKRLQRRPPRNYEIFCDSVRACNLANGYGVPSPKDSRYKEIERLVKEAVRLKMVLLPQKVRMTFVKGHAGIRGNTRADNLANEGREKMKYRRLEREEFFWPFENETKNY